MKKITEKIDLYLRTFNESRSMSPNSADIIKVGSLTFTKKEKQKKIAKNWINKPESKRLRYGLCELYYNLDLNRIAINYMGNMGARLSDVDEAVQNLLKISLKQLKQLGKIVVETGSPDYQYILELDFN
jgi:hypothetical protein